MAPPGDRLESWKEIATFLNKGVRTVQRWERTEGLPVHRHMHDRLGTVYAYRSELEAWWANRSPSLSSESPAIPMTARRVRWEWAAATAVVVLAVAGWKMTAEAGPEIRLGEGIPFTSSPAFEFQPAFSPDGRFVVYGVSDGKLPGDLYLQSVGRGEPERFTTSPLYEVSPSWSPDGHHIAYMRGEGKSAAEVIVQPTVRGTEKKVADIRYHGQSLPLMTWSADSQWLIAADKPDETTRAGLFRFHTVSGERRRLTTTCNTCVADSSLSRSPDGSELVFLRFLEDGRRDVWLLPLARDGSATGEPRRLTELNAHIGVPMWLPGGRDIAFPMLNDFSWRWQRISRSGPVSYASMHDFDTLARVRPRAVFSPDGRYLIASDDTEDHNIRRLDLSTGEERDVIVSTRIETNAQISPDGTQIAFPSSRRGNIEIWKAGADGSNAVQLTSVPGKSAGTPRWSPDGKQIALDIADSRNSDVWVMNSDGGQMRRLTDHPARDFVPSWSRNGQWIYFGSDREGTEIWKAPVNGGDPVRVTKNGGFGAWESHDGSFLYVAKSGSGKGVRGPGGLWRVRLSDASEERIPEINTDWSRYAVRPDGIYFIGAGANDCHTVGFYDFRLESVRIVKALERVSSMGFSVSPDGKWLVYTSVERSGSDLLLYAVHR